MAENYDGIVEGGTEGVEPVEPNSDGAEGVSKEPTPVELTEDSLVKLPGMAKPVKYGEYYRGFQSQFTKKAKAAAEAAERAAKLERDLQERDRRLEQLQRTQAGGGAPQNKGAEIAQALKALPYLSGEEAARVVEFLQREVGNQSEALSRRDQAILYLGKQLEQVQGLVNGMHQESSSQKFDGKIRKWMKEMDLPDEVEDFVKETYLAYEGADLDSEFPSILGKRWEQLQKAIRALDQRKVQNARPNPFLPKRGGGAVPSKPLKQGYKTPAQMADELFPFVKGDS